jgi:hypothetical protein
MHEGLLHLENHFQADNLVQVRKLVFCRTIGEMEEAMLTPELENKIQSLSFY